MTALLASSAHSGAATVPRGPYLQRATPTSLIVRWRTDVATDSYVRYGTSAGTLDLVASDVVSTTEHVVTLTDLAPDTQYYYSVGSTTETLAGGPTYSFFTPPPTGTPAPPALPHPIRIWVLGDSGTKDSNARAVRDAYTTFTGSRYTDLWLMLGDNAYDIGTDTEYQAAVFSMYPEVLRQTPLWPTIGSRAGRHAMSAPCRGVWLAFGVAWVLAAPTAALAHGDLHEQIVTATQRIETEPGNAELRLRRGELHRLHGDWPAARADYHTAATLDPELVAVDLARGRLWADSGEWEKARTPLDRFLARRPHHADALATRARVLTKLGDPAAAADDLARAIQSSAGADPELFIERAATLVACGSKKVDAALQCLDEGIAKFGPLVTLELPAIELEMRQARYDAALTRLEKAAAASPRKESWLARRGEILDRAGRPAEARTAFRAALAAIDSLPPRTRHTKAVTELTARLRARL